MSDIFQQLKEVFVCIYSDPPKVGDRVRLCEHEYENENRPFFYGDEFVIEFIDGRSYHLINDDGERLCVLDKHVEFL